MVNFSPLVKKYKRIIIEYPELNKFMELVTYNKLKKSLREIYRYDIEQTNELYYDDIELYCGNLEQLKEEELKTKNLSDKVLSIENYIVNQRKLTKELKNELDELKMKDKNNCEFDENNYRNKINEIKNKIEKIQKEYDQEKLRMRPWILELGFEISRMFKSKISDCLDHLKDLEFDVREL